MKASSGYLGPSERAGQRTDVSDHDVHSSLDVERGAILRTLFVAGRYPEDLTTDIVVSTGATLRLRAIRASDADKLVAFHSRLSSGSIYRRYFTEHPKLAEEEVRHFTRVDYVDRMALVVLDGEDLVAVGRFDRYPLTERAEVAFIVRDEYQHLGLGHRLLAYLAEAAWARGVTTFSAETLFSNIGMISVFRHSGFPVTSSTSMGEVSLTFPIQPTEESAALLSRYRNGPT
jgi:GNAT superfamily N-acetyltransferase